MTLKLAALALIVISALHFGLWACGLDGPEPDTPPQSQTAPPPGGFFMR